MIRRDTTPPYEIFRRKPAAGGPAPGAGSGLLAGRGARGSGGAKDERAMWRVARGCLPNWVRQSPEIEFRLPRALVWCLSAVGLGVIVLAFVVGYWQGGSATAGQSAAANASGAGLVNPAFDKPPARTVSADRTSNDPAAYANADPRQEGLNYMVLALPERQYAPPLVDFLAQHGVETTLVPVQNAMVQVIAVNKGFTAAELNSKARDEYEKWMRRVGRAWNRAHRSRGYNLSSMYFDRYEG